MLKKIARWILRKELKELNEKLNEYRSKNPQAAEYYNIDY